MSRRTARRAFSVDGVPYQVQIGRSHVNVWDASGKRHCPSHGDIQAVSPPSEPVPSEPVPSEPAADRGLAAVAAACARIHAWRAITPFQVANWIRATLQGKPAVARRTVPADPAPAAARPRARPPGEAYLVLHRWYHEDSGDYRTSVVEIHLDPQAALDAARRREAHRRRLCVLHDAYWKRRDAVREALGDIADRYAKVEEAMGLFFVEHGLLDADDREAVRSHQRPGERYWATRALLGAHDADSILEVLL